jgi:rod shape determining protein RodA
MIGLIPRIWTLFTRRVDGFLLVIALLLSGIGLATLYSASDESMQRLLSQLTSLSAALVLMWITSNLHPRQLARLAIPLYLLGLTLLFGVAVAGEVVNGARRWLNLGITRIQPSEVMKIALPLMLAWYFDRHEASLKLKDFAIAAILMGIPAALIAKQPDLGTALLIAAAGFYVVFLAGLSWKILLGLGLAGAAALPLVWPFLHDYQQERIRILIDPTRDPLGAGYHIIQSTIAIGSGGVIGKGWLNGTQTHLDFLPERHTDFIFAVFGEEFGLIGNVVLLILYLLLIGRGLVISANASKLFTRLLAGAITLMFFTYALVNMGMVTGVLPVVGVPLPLISYGGTSLVTLFVGLGILMSIQSHRSLVKT